MIVELFGAPGAGKTTLTPVVMEHLARSHPRVEKASRAGLTVLRPSHPADDLPGSLWRKTFRVVRWVWGWSMVLADPARIGLLRNQRRRPAAAMVRRRKVIYWWVRTLGLRRILDRYPVEWVAVFDEGPVHRVVQLFCSPSETPSRSQVEKYLSMIPLPDMAVFVSTPPETCVERVRQRGVWDHFEQLTAAEVEAFVTNAHHGLTEVCRVLRELGVRVIEVDNSGETGGYEGLAATLAAGSPA